VLAIGAVINSVVMISRTLLDNMAHLPAGSILRTIEDEHILDHVQEVGAHFVDGLRRLQKKYAFITEVRGRGLMVAAELDRPGGHMVVKAMERGYLINCTVDRVLRFLPPLIITQPEVDGLLTTLDAIFAEE